MKQILKTIIIALFCFSGFQNMAQTTVTIRFLNGNEEVYKVEESGGIYFSDSELYLNTTSGTTSNYALSDIQKLLFTPETTGLENISSIEDILIYPNPATDYICLLNSGSSTDISILDIRGSLLFQGTYTEGEKIDIKTLPQGLYLLKINNKTLKFSKL